MADKKGIDKVKFETLSNGNTVASYFDSSRNTHSHAWALPRSVTEELIIWWNKLPKDNGVHPPIKEKIRNCEFTVHTENYIDIEEYFFPDSPKKNFWTLSVDTVEELVTWAEKMI